MSSRIFVHRTFVSWRIRKHFALCEIVATLFRSVASCQLSCESIHRDEYPARPCYPFQQSLRVMQIFQLVRDKFFNSRDANLWICVKSFHPSLWICLTRASTFQRVGPSFAAQNWAELDIRVFHWRLKQIIVNLVIDIGDHRWQDSRVSMFKIAHSLDLTSVPQKILFPWNFEGFHVDGLSVICISIEKEMLAVFIGTFWQLYSRYILGGIPSSKMIYFLTMVRENSDFTRLLSRCRSLQSVTQSRKRRPKNGSSRSWARNSHQVKRSKMSSRMDRCCAIWWTRSPLDPSPRSIAAVVNSKWWKISTRK